MRKPKIKKRRGYWLIYTNKKRAFKVFNPSIITFYYNLLLKEI